MHIRNIGDRTIEMLEGGDFHVLPPGAQIACEHVINAETWEKNFPGEVARFYEEGEWSPDPQGDILIIGKNHTGEPKADFVPEKKEPSDPTKVLLKDLPNKTRAELNKIAQHVGLEEPESYKTKAELIAAFHEVVGDQNYIDLK